MLGLLRFPFEQACHACAQTTAHMQHLKPWVRTRTSHVLLADSGSPALNPKAQK